MKYSKLLIVPSILASLVIMPIHAEMILQKAEIDQKALQIEAKANRERYLVYSLTALSVAHELYQWAPLLGSFFGLLPEVAPKTEEKSMLQACKAGLRSLFYTKEGWVSMAQCSVSIAGFMMISKVGEKIVHPDSLYWYVNARAPYKRTIVMMQERLFALQDPNLEQAAIQQHKDFLPVLYDRLIMQAKLLCGYMTYKSKHLEVEEKAIAQRATAMMINSQNSWLSRIGDLLQADEQNYTEIDKALVAYGADIAAQLNYFSVVEGETPYDRAEVRRQVKVASE